MVDVATDAAAIAGAVTGAGTPDNVSVKRPVREITWGLFLVLLCMLAFALFLAVDLSQGWGWPESTAKDRINYIGMALVISNLGLIVVVVALAGFGRVEARAGMAELKVGS